MDIKEKRFEQDIETFFLSEQGGYVPLKSSRFDPDKCICMDVLCGFIEKTQPKAWEKYVKYYGDNASEKLCTPKLMRLAPAFRSACRYPSFTVPGFASIVISASSCIGIVFCTVSRIRVNSSQGKAVGVPPPT